MHMRYLCRCHIRHQITISRSSHENYSGIAFGWTSHDGTWWRSVLIGDTLVCPKIRSLEFRRNITHTKTQFNSEKGKSHKQSSVFEFYSCINKGQHLISCLSEVFHFSCRSTTCHFRRSWKAENAIMRLKITSHLQLPTQQVSTVRRKRRKNTTVRDLAFGFHAGV